MSCRSNIDIFPFGEYFVWKSPENNQFTFILFSILFSII